MTDAQDNPTVTVSGLPSGLVYESGQVTGTISSDVAVGDYVVTISADDGSNPAVSATFTIAVTPNTPPTIINPGGKSYYKGESITAFVATVTDVQDNPTVTVSGLPSGLVYGSGQVTGTISSDATVGDYTVTISATDSFNPPVSATFTITIANPTPAELVELVKDGVVRVTAGRSAGSGFIFDTEGDTAFVATVHHVVEDEDAIDVQVENSRTYKATLLGYDSDSDVAVMSICCNSDFHSLDWSTNTSYEVGEQVVAVGYPRSSSSSVTATIGKVKGDIWGYIFDYIAHDAPLNPGNSGGPLFSMEGKVLGLNRSASRITEGLFYAVPYSTIEDDVADWKSRLIVTVEPSPTPVPPGSTPTPVCNPGLLGSRECPLPFGVPAEVRFDEMDHWEITVLSIQPDATDAVLSHNRFNDPPGAGNQFYMVTIRNKYLGPGSTEFGRKRPNALGVGGVVYDGSSNDCDSIPNGLPNPELFMGGTIEGNVCWEIASSDADSLVMIIDADDYRNDDRAWFALK